VATRAQMVLLKAALRGDGEANCRMFTDELSELPLAVTIRFETESYIKE
jgi:hypothetical protein